MSGNFSRFLILLFSLAVIGASAARADTVQLKEGHPDRYVVVKGDTLWDISARFLKSPWHWPRIWKINQQIANPHLIYPGDVILLTYGADGQPMLTVQRTEKLAPPTTETLEGAPPAAAPSGDGRTVKLSPKIRVESLESAIPTIPPAEIAPYLSKPLVVGRTELERAGYVTVGLDNRLILGAGSEFYARGINNREEEFKIFRQGDELRDPETGKVLAWEAVDLGDARMLEPGDPAKLVIVAARQEIQPRDRLLVSPKQEALPYYAPRPPTTKVRGWILAAEHTVAEIGPNVVVAVSVGRKDGIEDGNVLRVMRHVGKQRDPVTRRNYQLPEEESGLLMIFRTFDEVSYGLIMTASQPIHINDAVITP